METNTSISGESSVIDGSGNAQAWKWQVGRGLEAIERLRPQWEELAARLSLSALLGPTWARCFWRAFGPSDRSLFVHSLYRDGQLVAILPLRLARWPVACWHSITSDQHSPYWSVPLAEPSPAVGEQILQHLLSSAAMVDLRRLYAKGPLCMALAQGAQGRRRVVLECDDDDGDCMIDLSQGTGGELARRDRQRLRSLEKLGTLTWENVTAPDRTAQVLDECMRLEAAGWKGRHGSPILASSATRMFYSELAIEAAKSGQLVLHTLRLDGRLLAFSYLLYANGRLDGLKTSYDPEFAKYSPGTIVCDHIKQAMPLEHIRTFHFGRPAPYKLKAANRVEPIARLRVYGRGAAATGAYVLGPVLRGTLRKSRLLRAGVSGTRRMAKSAAHRLRNLMVLDRSLRAEGPD